LALDEADVTHALADLERRFGERHRALVDVFERHAARVVDRVPQGARLSPARRQLLGAAFTNEYAVEAAALCNPSIVEHADQHGVAPGAVRVVMSARAIGEGHRSSLCFRLGIVDGNGNVALDPPGAHPILGATSDAWLDRSVFQGRLRELGLDDDNATSVLGGLGERFSGQDLEHALERLDAQGDTRRNTSATADHLREIAARSYTVQFPPGSDISERVLWPATATESQGIEDARFVRFVEDDGSARYLATYTAFNGNAIAQQLLETDDFVTFGSSPIVGAAAANKGLALFPRRIDGQYVALSRFDQETNSIAFSDRLGHWDYAMVLQVPSASWEIVQLGNCGSPIETDRGWLVLTHGVGPMRTYSVGALLLDLDDPVRVIGRLTEPLLTPIAEESVGYVPNVVYSCGALLHAGTLVVPYGFADTGVGFATVPVVDLLDALTDAVGVAVSRPPSEQG
jgi:predicted GH43/DUF377 family glycosyl hydrolase